MKSMILIKTESHYTVDRKRIREVVDKFLRERGVKGDIETSLAIVGDRMMRSLNRKYRNINRTADVLAFPLSVNSSNVPFLNPPDNVLRLGDIVISYPQARDSAREEDKLIDDKIDELVIHGMKHLLGQNQE